MWPEVQRGKDNEEEKALHLNEAHCKQSVWPAEEKEVLKLLFQPAQVRCFEEGTYLRLFKGSLIGKEKHHVLAEKYPLCFFIS